MTDIQDIDLQALEAAEFQTLVTMVNTEAQRRRVLATYTEDMDRLQTAYQQARGIIKGTGAEWTPPTGAHDTYRLGDIIKYQGKYWRSTIPNNAWSPADYPDGWEQVEEADLPEGTGEETTLDYPEWAAGIDYKTGDRVTHNGVAYEITQPHTSAAHWLPADVPALYSRIS